MTEDDGGSSPAPRGRGEDVARWLDAHPLPLRLVRAPEKIDIDVQRLRAGWD